MLATLPMYLRPETRDAHDAFWALTRDALRDHGHAAPDGLDHGVAHHTTWTRPDLLLGQICNLPYRRHAHSHTFRVGTCDFGLPDTPPGHYFSHFVVRAYDPRAAPEDFATARLAVNEPHSHSGWGAVWTYAQAHGFAFRNAVLSGGHAASARAIAQGHADIAAIDAVSWQLITRYDTSARDLRIIGRTAASPGQTLITARTNDPAPLRAALDAALIALPQRHRETFLLRRLIDLPDAAYHDMSLPKAPPLVAQRA